MTALITAAAFASSKPVSYTHLLLLLNLLAIFLHMIWNERRLAFQILQKIHMETGSVLREMELKCSDVLKNKEEI